MICIHCGKSNDIVNYEEFMSKLNQEKKAEAATRLVNEAFEVEPEMDTEPEVEAEVEDDSSRWVYYVVKNVEFEAGTKNEVKRWLQEQANGIEGLRVVRGRQLSTNEKIKRIVSIL